MHAARQCCVLGHSTMSLEGSAAVSHSIDLSFPQMGITIHNPLLSSKRQELLYSFCRHENQGGERGKLSVSLAPEGAEQAAKLCPPTLRLVSTGEHSLPKQTPWGLLLPTACQCPKSCRGSRAKPMEAQSSLPLSKCML